MEIYKHFIYEFLDFDLQYCWFSWKTKKKVFGKQCNILKIVNISMAKKNMRMRCLGDSYTKIFVSVIMV